LPVTEFEYDLRRLRSDLEGDVRRVEDDLRGEIDSARNALHEFAAGWASASELYETLDERCTAAATTAEEALDQARHTAAWLARYTRPGGPRVVVDPTDRPGTSLGALALKADQAAYFGRRLLTKQQRDQLLADIAAAQQRHRAHTAAEPAAVTASETLANTATTDPAHDAAAAQFAEASGELKQLSRNRDHIDRKAEAARTRLREDNAERAEHEAGIADGVQAGAELRRVLKQQISQAVEADALFAPWFTRTFGFTPDSDDRLDLAVEVCAYRITYRISSDNPLGSPPDSATPGHRRTGTTSCASTWPDTAPTDRCAYPTARSPRGTPPHRESSCGTTAALRSSNPVFPPRCR
jgi:hypothetical protein